MHVDKITKTFSQITVLVAKCSVAGENLLGLQREIYRDSRRLVNLSGGDEHVQLIHRREQQGCRVATEE